MFDIRWIREKPQALIDALVKRQWSEEEARSTVEGVLLLDEQRRAHLGELQVKQERRNNASREIGNAMRAGNMALAEALKLEVNAIKAFLSAAEQTERDNDAALNDALAVIPNAPLDEVPVGRDEHDNVEVRRVGAVRARSNWTREHFEIGEALGLMDFERAAKLSGARFTVLKGQLARLERALGQFMLDLHTSEHGYTEVQPPLLVRDEVLYGTGSLPKFEEDLFFVRHGEGRLGLIPTSEVPLTNLVREEILRHDELPLRFTALTPCFRSEAGSAGRDTRGMLRQHQFYKVELVSITDQESSLAEHERMTQCAEEVLIAARPAVPHDHAVYRRHGLPIAQDLRHRGLAAGPGRLSRNLVLFGLRRLPGAAHGCALPPEGRKGDPLRPYAQRLRRRRRPGADCRHRELSEPERLNKHS